MTIHIHRNRLFAVVLLCEGREVKVRTTMDKDVQEDDERIKRLIRRYRHEKVKS